MSRRQLSGLLLDGGSSNTAGVTRKGMIQPPAAARARPALHRLRASQAGQLLTSFARNACFSPAIAFVLRGPTRGRPCSPATIRVQLGNIARAARVRRRFAPHQLRHAHAVEMSREGVPLLVIQRQLGHADLGITSAYLRGIDNTEIIHAVHERPAPMIPASASLRPTL